MTKRTSSTPINPGIIYDYDKVRLFLSRVWISCADAKDITECLGNYIRIATPKAENGYLYFEGMPVAQGDPRELNAAKDVLYDILRSKEIIDDISDLKSSANGLKEQVKRIDELLKPITDSIDQGLYPTRIRGCCTNLTLLRKI